MARSGRGKEIDGVIDRGAARLDTLPESVLVERVQKVAATTNWTIERLGDDWALFDETGQLDFEDRSLGTAAFLVGMYADPKEKPDAVVKRYYGDLFDLPGLS